jgi:hypothetical protein
MLPVSLVVKRAQPAKPVARRTPAPAAAPSLLATHMLGPKNVRIMKTGDSLDAAYDEFVKDIGMS